MGTKTISIMDDVYEVLARHKKSDESFSDELRRVFAKEKKDILQFAGAWSEQTAQGVKEAIKRLRRELDEEAGKKFK